MPEYKIMVYGHSDDLIELRDDVREEFYANYGKPTHIMVGDTELVAEYDGEWHFDIVDQGANDNVSIYGVGNLSNVEDVNDYTEVVIVESDNHHASKIET